jgi:hypothetical protein
MLGKDSWQSVPQVELPTCSALVSGALGSSQPDGHACVGCVECVGWALNGGCDLGDFVGVVGSSKGASVVSSVMPSSESAVTHVMAAGHAVSAAGQEVTVTSIVV